MNPNLNFTHSKAPLRTIQRVQFGILAPNEIVSVFYLMMCLNYRFELFFPVEIQPLFFRNKAR